MCFAISSTSTATADDICLPVAELEAAAKELDRAKETARRCVSEAHEIRTQRDLCRGSMDEKEIQNKALRMELAEVKGHNELLKSELDSKWSAWIWFGIGVALPAGGFVAWHVMD